MRAGGRRANKVHSHLLRELLGFDVEIVNHLHVIRNKTDRRDNDIPHAFQLFKVVANIWTEPWLRRRTAAALINNFPVLDAECLGDQSPRFLELDCVVALCRHRFRNGVRSESQMSHVAVELRVRLAYVIDIRFYEQRMIIEGA